MSWKEETYFSLDVETNGPVPGLYSMLSIGIAVFEHGQLTGTFSANLTELEGAGQLPETMQWWQTQPKAWGICRKDLRDPVEVMQDACKFVESFPGARVAVGWPVAFDWMFVCWYFWKFCGKCPLGFDAMDLRSYVAGLNRYPAYLDVPESEISSLAKKREGLIPHEALSDAIGQGDLLMAAVEFARKEQPGRKIAIGLGASINSLSGM